MALATAGCAGRGGVSRPLTQHESEILNLWKQMRLSNPEFQAGTLIAFLKQLRKIID